MVNWKIHGRAMRGTVGGAIRGNPLTFPYAPVGLASSYNTCRLGEHGKYPACSECGNTDCEGVKDASVAPLCELPSYMAAKHPEVRKAAKARFIELKEEKVDAAMFEAWPGLVDKVDVVTVCLKSSGEVWSWDNGHSLLVNRLIAEALETPIDNLPKYITSRFREVRKAAKTRFVELQEL